MDDGTRVPPDEQETFLTEIGQNRLAPLWKIYQTLVIEEPNRVPPPVVWKWSEMVPVIEKSANLVTGEAADHRVLILDNPHLDGPPATSPTIVAAYQCVLPGEKTPPHRHTPAATRVILEGAGGATFVDGKRCNMHDGDLIITPNWTWHCHENDSGARAVWLDILDLPLVAKLDAVFGDMGPADTLPENISTLPDNAFSRGGLIPVSTAAAVRHSPRLRYPWSEVVATMDAAPAEADGSRTVAYCNPIDGSPLTPTLDSRAIALKGRQATGKLRTTSNAVAIVLDGEGVSEIGDQEIAWGPRDVFTLPHWTWTSHRSATDTAHMIVISDREMLSKLNLLREEVA